MNIPNKLYHSLKAKILLFLLLVSLAANAQPRISFYGFVFQKYMHRPLTDVNVTFLSQDSVAIDSIKPSEGTMEIQGRTASWCYTLRGKQYGPYIVRIEADGYQTAYINIPKVENIKESFMFKDAGNVFLSVKPRTKNLGEATVTATKIKFYNNGDTLVYNADAFNLAKGSMLDELIRQLPGVELNDNGEIKVNGRKVESLLLNGRDFFNKNNQLMLDNLPAYIVKKLKVYDRNKQQVNPFALQNEKELVMDVQLKKEFSLGWIGNIEAGGGTKDRFMARLFALCFGDRSQLAIIGNLNNLNDTRRPGQETDWTPDKMPSGTTVTRMAALSYDFDDILKNLKYNATAQVSHNTTSSFETENGEQFLASGNTFSRNYNDSHSGITRIETTHSVIKMGKADFNLLFNGDYTHANMHGYNAAATFLSDPMLQLDKNASLLDTLMSINGNKRSALLNKLAINRVYTSQLQKWNNGNGDFSFNVGKKGWSIGGASNFNVSKTDFFEHYLLDFPTTANSERTFHNRYAHTAPNYKVKNEFNIGYGRGVTKMNYVSLTYTTRQTYEKKRYDLHLLERQTGWGDDTDQALGTLPSESEWMRNETFDAKNSFTYSRKPIENELELYANCNGDVKEGKGQLNCFLKLPVTLVQQRLNYQRDTYNAFTHRHDYMFNPTARFRYTRTDKSYADVEIIYNMKESLPDLLDHLLTLPNTYDPLNTYLGNANLKRSQTHNLDIRFTKNYDKKFYTNRSLTANYNYIHNAIARGFTYNPTTGVRTFMPQNVDGNQYANIGYRQYIFWGKGDKWGVQYETKLGWQHGVDLITITEQSYLPTKSVVNNWSAYQRVASQLSLTKFTISVSASVLYNAARAKKDYFINQDVWSYQYGITAKATLPWDIKLSTDLKVYGNHGFADPAGNKDKLVWNARLSRSIKNPNLTFVIDGFDMLHQLSNRSFTINSQGRTEIYRNALPSYFLAHVIWHFNKARKHAGGN